MSDAGCTSFGELVASGILVVSDGYRAKLDELGGDGPVFLRAGALTTQGFVWSGLDSFRSDLVHRVAGKLGLSGDVVITTKGNSIGRTGWVPTDAPPFVYSPHLSFWRSVDRDVLDPRFLHYWSQSIEFTSQLRTFGFATDMAPYLSLRDQFRLEISCPRIASQRAIAEVLGALDDKIAANAKLATTVDDLLASKFARLTSASTSAPLGTIAGVNVASTRPNVGGSLRYLDIAAVGVGGYEMPEVISWDDAPGRARRVIATGDTVWSTVRPNRRSHALVLDQDPLLIGSTGLAVLTSRNNQFAFLYEATRTETFTRFLESAAEGSAYPAVRADQFLDAPVPEITPAEREAFEREAAPLRRRSHSASVESRRLAATRDALLPLLMSGKIRVKDAESVVGGVV